MVFAVSEGWLGSMMKMLMMWLFLYGRCCLQYIGLGLGLSGGFLIRMKLNVVFNVIEGLLLLLLGPDILHHRRPRHVYARADNDASSKPVCMQVR